MCLAISMYLEIKNEKSIKYIVGLLKSVTDAEILNLKTHDTFFARSELGEGVGNLLH